jgi:hypothetical protein
LFQSLSQEEHFEASIAELTQFNTIIVCVYRPPNSNINIFIEILDTIISNLIISWYFSEVTVSEKNIGPTIRFRDIAHQQPIFCECSGTS